MLILGLPCCIGRSTIGIVVGGRFLRLRIPVLSSLSVGLALEKALELRETGILLVKIVVLHLRGRGCTVFMAGKCSVGIYQFKVIRARCGADG